MTSNKVLEECNRNQRETITRLQGEISSLTSECLRRQATIDAAIAQINYAIKQIECFKEGLLEKDAEIVRKDKDIEGLVYALEMQTRKVLNPDVYLKRLQEKDLLIKSLEDKLKSLSVQTDMEDK